MTLARIFGIIGLILITTGIFKNDESQNILFALGGAGLLVYSISLRDPVFIPLQTIFIFASLYEIYLLRKKRKK